MTDPASLDAAFKDAAVVLTTAGPYTHWGTPVLEAALRTGTHYADLTAEVPWMLNMMDKHGVEATAKGVKIVHCAGFDSQPTDLISHLVTAECVARTGAPPERVFTVAGKAKGGFSGGTIASLLAAMYEAPKAALARGAHPYSLTTGTGAKAVSDQVAIEEGDPAGARWCEPAAAWTAPFVMAFINARVARRSAALRPGLYGSEYKHTEVMEMPGRFAAFAASAATAGFALALKLPFARHALRAIAPKQGTGPSMALCKGGHWEMRGYAVARPDPASGKRRMVKGVAADPGRDPGYWGTSRMMLELGLALALDGPACEAAGCLKGGFLTPATAGGAVLVDRLRSAGLTVDVLEEDGTTV